MHGLGTLEMCTRVIAGQPEKTCTHAGCHAIIASEHLLSITMVTPAHHCPPHADYVSCSYCRGQRPL